MAAADHEQAGGSSRPEAQSPPQQPPQQQQHQGHHDEKHQQQRRPKPQVPPLELPPLAPKPLIRRSSSAELSRHWKDALAVISPKKALTPRTDGARARGFGGGVETRRVALARKRSRTMGDDELAAAVGGEEGPHTPTHRGLSHSDSFRQALETKWRAARAARVLEQRSQHGPADELHAPGRSAESAGHHHHHHHHHGGFHPGPVLRFAAVAVDMDDALRLPSVDKTDSLAILVDQIVPEAAAAAPEAAEALCLPGTQGHAVMLWAACACAFGAAFGKAVVSAVSSPLMADMGLSKQAYGTLAGLPAITSIVSGPLGGLLVDRWGPDKGCVAFAACVAVGGALAAVALPFESVACLALSQVVMGIGKGTLTTAQKVFLRLACSPGEASFFFALSFSLTHLGTFLAFILAPLVEDASPLGYKAAVYTSAGITLACLLLTLPLLGRLDHILSFLHRDVDSSCSNASLSRGESEESMGTWERDPSGVPVARALPHHHHHHAHAGHEMVSTAAETTDGSALSLSLSRSSSSLEEGEEEEAEAQATGLGRWWAWASGVLHPADLCTPAFGLLLLSNLMFYCFFAPLEAFAVPALTSMAGFSPAKASLGASILPALSIVLSPPFGAVVDIELGKGGRRHSGWLRRLWPAGSTQLWAMLLPALGIGAIIAHPSLWALGFGLISLGYALSCASLWIVIPEFVATRSLGLSFGLIHAVDDAGILAVQVAIGRMLDRGKTYRGSVLPMLLAFALLGAGATVALMRLLKRKLDAASALPEHGAGLERESEVELILEPSGVPMTTTVLRVESPN